MLSPSGFKIHNSELEGMPFGMPSFCFIRVFLFFGEKTSTGVNQSKVEDFCITDAHQ